MTTIRFSDRLNIASSTTDSGITRRGNWILRTRLSLSTHAAHGARRGLGEEREQHDRGQQLRAVEVAARAQALADVRRSW